MHPRRNVEVCLCDQTKLRGAFRMHDQSITLKLDLPEFAVQGTITDQKGDLLVIVTANDLPTCPGCGGGEVSLHDRRKQWVEDRPL